MHIEQYFFSSIAKLSQIATPTAFCTHNENNKTNDREYQELPMVHRNTSYGASDV